MVDSFAQNGTHDVLSELGNCTFKIFTSILFGEDIKDMKSIHYIDKDDKTIELPFKDFFNRLFGDYIQVYYSLWSGIFPFLNDYNLVNPFKRNSKNLATFKECLKESLDESKDPNSIWNKGMSIVDDLILLMLAGSDTSSHTLTSVLYYLKK